MSHVSIEFDVGTLDDVLSLQHEINSDSDLRGSARRTETDASDAALGSITEALTVFLGSGGALTAFAPVLISWIRNRHSNISLRVKRQNGTEIELNAQRVKRSTPGQIAELARQVAQLVEGEE